MLTLDSALDELAGPQGEWLQYQLTHVQSGIDFVFVILHHPPYLSSSDAKTYGGGHSAHTQKQNLTAYLDGATDEIACAHRCLCRTRTQL
jgi:hypothetical protein